jgi:type II secretory pathway pseudopilin PulG
VAILLSILALGAFSLFMMYSNAARETGARLKIHRQNEAVMDEVGRGVRASVRILELLMPPNSVETFDPDNPTGDKDVNGFMLLDADGVKVRGFEFRDSVLYTYDTVGSWQPFTIDGTPIKLASGLDANGQPIENAFTLGSDRRWLTARYTLTTVAGGQTYTIPFERGIFKCRL